MIIWIPCSVPERNIFVQLTKTAETHDYLPLAESLSPTNMLRHMGDYFCQSLGEGSTRDGEVSCKTYGRTGSVVHLRQPLVSKKSKKKQSKKNQSKSKMVLSFPLLKEGKSELPHYQSLIPFLIIFRSFTPWVCGSVQHPQIAPIFLIRWGRRVLRWGGEEPRDIHRGQTQQLSAQ